MAYTPSSDASDAGASAGIYEYSQASITFNGSQDIVKLVSADVTEALSELYTISATVVSGGDEIDFFGHLGETVSIVNAFGGEATREFNGIISDAEYVGADLDEREERVLRHYYRLTIRPRLYQLAFNRAYAVYQDVTVVDVVTKVLQSCGTSVRPLLSGTYSPMDYSVQYGESDFAYLSRLLEQSGIYYYFTHDGGREAFVICDRSSANARATHSLGYLVSARDKGLASESGSLSAWHESLRGTGEHQTRVTFYDFEQSETRSGVNTPKKNPLKWSLAQLKVHSDSARLPPFDDPNLTGAANVRMAAVESRRRVYSGQAATTSLAAGDKIAVEHHPVDRYNSSYTIIRLHTRLAGDWEGNAMDVFDGAGSTFDAIPDTIDWQPPLLTAVPVAHGPETATVLGGDNEEIATDKYGRVKVRFHWSPKAEPASVSCWMRVSQTGGLGNIILPRAGHEVVVDFLDGNPDRPLIVGRVFNKNNMPVYALPANKTRALWRSKTYGDPNAALEGGAEELEDTKNPGANEIRFEDMSGKEEFFMHAQRDMNVRVRNNSTHHVGRNLEVKVFNDESKVVKKNSSVEIQGDEKQVTKKSRTVEITGQTKINTTDNYTLEVKGGQVTMSSDVGFTIKCGDNKIEMTPAGITMSGTIITVESKAVSEYKAGATMTIKGAMVMIN